MNEGFSKLFWGFLLVLFEIHFFVIDILPDPIGYLLIYSGNKYLVKEFPIDELANKASVFSIVLLVLSIPDMFIAQTTINQMGHALSYWTISFTVLSLLKIILVFYCFNIMLEIGNLKNLDELVIKSKNLFKIYMGFMITMHILSPFKMNFSSDSILIFSFFIMFCVFLLEILFLVYLRRYSKLTI